MTEEKQEKQVWTINELVSMTETVQSAEIEYAGKVLPIQWVELVESEEPKMALPSEDTPEDEVSVYYREMAQARVSKMINKANEKNPEGITLKPEDFEKLPTTLRWQVSGVIIGGESAASDFING